MDFNKFTSKFLKDVITKYNYLVNVKGHHKLKKTELVNVMKDLFYIEGDKIYPKSLNFNSSWDIPRKKTAKERKEEKMNENYDYFKVLGLKSFTTLADIKKAYKKLAKLYHPDKGKGNEAKFIAIDNAYKYLLRVYKKK